MFGPLLSLLTACAITAAPPSSDKGDGTDSGNDCTAPTAWFADADLDGYGASLYTVDACTQPTGYVASAADCDDTDAAIHPGVDETCDGVDEDCDGTADEEATDAPLWYGDTDGDGFGDEENAVAACNSPVGYTSDHADCDDTSFATNPDATESCNTLDDDCDGETDEPDAEDALTWFADIDGDDFGDPESTTLACTAPSGFVADDNDCDDTRAEANPDGVEVCNGLDDDCDSTVDDNPTDPATWYFDADADGFGRESPTLTACEQPSNYAATGDDCNDVDAAVHPGAVEHCDTTDNDCDGDVAEDDSVDATTWYADADADGYGDASSTHAACSIPAGYSANATDCDDTDAGVSPGDAEYCGGGDENCDGVTDESTAADATAYYADLDADTFGDADAVVMSCTAVADRVTNSEDCDDSTDTISPDASDTCGDGIDQDCDGSADAGCWVSGARDVTTGDLVMEGRAGDAIGNVMVGGIDMTGDGVPDGAFSSFAPDAGYYVVSGDLRGSLTVSATTAHFESVGTTLYQLCAGDVDGDGTGDMLALADQAAWLDRGPFSVGSSSVATDAYIYTTHGTSGTYSYSCAIGDLDDDGVREVIIGVPYDGFSAPYGRVDVYENPSGDKYSSGARAAWTGGTADFYLGYTVASGADIDGDGADDLLMASSSGHAYVIFGPATGGGTASAAADVTLAPSSEYISAAMLPDADGDGHGDILLGNQWHDPSGSSARGGAFLFTGLSSSGTAFSWTGFVEGEDASAALGRHLSAADVDGDGLTDLLLGASNRTPKLVFSPISGTVSASAADTTFSMTDYASANIVNIGDVDGLGFDSLLVSSPGDDSGGVDAGYAAIFLGAGD